MSRRAWGWAAALRDGATTPWSEWAGEAEPAGRFLPGVQQLEVLRRLNGLAGPSRPDPALADRVLRASAAGRGLPDLALTGDDDATWGPDPVDPVTLPPGELLRVASTLLAEDVAASGLPPEPRRRVPRRLRVPTPRVAGAPWLAGQVRDELDRRGRRPGGRRSPALVLGADVATMTELAWVERCFAGGGPPWPEWLETSVGRRRPPPRADLLRMATAWADGVGAQRVRVVLDHDRLPRLLRTRPLPAPVVPSADGTDLARRVAVPLALLVPAPERSAHLRRVLLPRLAAHPGPPLRLDPDRRAWAGEVAGRLAPQLVAAYAVVGEADRLRPPATDDAGHGPDPRRVLDLALRLLLERPGA
jgi:hypothetical protein